MHTIQFYTPKIKGPFAEDVSTYYYSNQTLDSLVIDKYSIRPEKKIHFQKSIEVYQYDQEQQLQSVQYKVWDLETDELLEERIEAFEYQDNGFVYIYKELPRKKLLSKRRLPLQYQLTYTFL